MGWCGLSHGRDGRESLSEDGRRDVSSDGWGAGDPGESQVPARRAPEVLSLPRCHAFRFRSQLGCIPGTGTVTQLRPSFKPFLRCLMS